jgi:hypothetical protein
MEETSLWCVSCGQNARHELCPCEDPERPFTTTVKVVMRDQSDADDLGTGHDLL